MNKFYSVILTCLLLFVSGVFAQEETPEPTPDGNCPAIVETALALTKSLCDDTGINEACYGHVAMEAEARKGVQIFQFDEPGDRVSVGDVQTLQLSAMDEATGQWGVLNVKVVAVPVDGSEIEEGTPLDVQILLFGDVELNDATQFVWIEATGNVNVRELPTTDSGDVVTSLVAGERVIANRRLEDSSWLRVRTSNNEGVGWVFAEFIEVSEDIDVLDVISLEDALAGVVDEKANYGPMQAVFFESGKDDNPCAEAPESGMLIQTPEGVAYVEIWMDEVVIRLDGTGVIQAQANGDFTLGVIEGDAEITAMGESTTLLKGTSSNVPLGEDSTAIDVPGDPLPFDATTMGTLPIDLLDDEVTIPEPRTIVPGQPLEGLWLFSWGVESATCPDGTVVPFESAGNTGEIRLQDGGFVWGDIAYNEGPQGVYTATHSDALGNLHQDTLTVIAPDKISGEKIIDLVNPICTLDVPFSIQLKSALDGD